MHIITIISSYICISLVLVLVYGGRAQVAKSVFQFIEETKIIIITILYMIH